jgi:hypothetical protein
MSVQSTLALNAQCDCLPLERTELRAGLVGALRDRALAPLLARTLDERPNLLAETAVFLGDEDWARLQDAVRTMEQQLWSAPYLSALAQTADSIPGSPPAAGSGLMRAYDFHLTANGPQLIEINTNAGGGFVVLALQRAVATGQISLGGEPCALAAPFDTAAATRAIVASFAQEWKSVQGTLLRPRPLRDIAIVDERPDQEFLYPDMILALDALRDAGYHARITPLSALTAAPGGPGLLADDQGPVDLVYNRSTDFALSRSESRSLRQASAMRETLVSPSPWHHQIYAHKSRLTLLAQTQPARGGARLPWVPAAQPVQPEQADDLWARRKSLFFKPVDGFGSKAVYDGRKLTRGTWQSLQARAYIAQETIPPPRRRVQQNETRLRFDLRVFAYGGEAIFACARLYRGQTTNFRTPGGGLAMVLRADC